jgi:hypothetical protein
MEMPENVRTYFPISSSLVAEHEEGTEGIVLCYPAGKAFSLFGSRKWRDRKPLAWKRATGHYKKT